MRNRHARFLKKHGHLDFEEKKQRKRKSKARKAELEERGPRARKWSAADESDEPLIEKMVVASKRSTPRKTGPGPVDNGESDDGVAEERSPGLVLSITSGKAQVFVDGEQRPARVGAEVLLTQQTSLAVGDEVSIAFRGGQACIESVEARRTWISRPDPGNAHRERVLAANVDVAVIVSAVKSPPFKQGLVDRFLIALARGGVRPVICVNKIDLLDERELAELYEALVPYRALEIPVVLCSAEREEGTDELGEALAGSTCVFLGHSGVGKSSLLNALDPEGERATKSIRESDGKGRHTTTASTLRFFPNGTSAIDTPGLRALGLWQLDAAELREHFAEFDAFARACRFNDCRHVQEPECAVRAAMENGGVPAARYASYVRILETL